jgi:hypothetical protein
MHFIPTSSFWLNLVERWFREITDKLPIFNPASILNSVVLPLPFRPTTPMIFPASIEKFTSSSTKRLPYFLVR